MNAAANKSKSIARELAEQLLALVDDGKTMPVLLIDGRAGSGKSTLADEVQNEFFKLGESAPRVIHLDDLYPGWDGLQLGVEYLQRAILNPLGRREVAHYQLFDWAAGERREWREFAGGTPLIIEGVGSLSRIAAEQADITVWLEADQAVRQARIADRKAEGDGDGSWFAMWSAQEADFYAREKSSEIADFTISN